MVKLRRYILSHLSILFFSIFLPLFAIASVIFLIKLATYTAVIQLNIVEMGKLYLFAVPELLFYTLPISFVVSAVLTLYRLSNDNEMIVVFSLGISPTFIAKIFAKPALLLSLILFVDYLVVTPYIKIISDNFIDQKKAESKFNLTASEYGHHFGDWMLFINKSDAEKKKFDDIVLFNNNMDEEIFIIAKNAELVNNQGIVKLQLKNGISYSFNDLILKQMLFETAFINDIMKAESEVFTNPWEYWTNLTLYFPEYQMSLPHVKKIQQLSTNTLLSLFPILSIFLIVALGIVHARHQKRWIYLWLFLSIIGYYSAAMITQKWIGFHSIWVVTLSWIVFTYSIYKRLVGNRF
jgi:lipopolysaccharide export system permease protein